MYSLDEAERLVLQRINEKYGQGPDALVLLREHTIEKPYGWILFFNTRVYVETGNELESLGGNGPIVFERNGGHIHQLGSARDPEQEIADFERAKGL